MKYGNLNLLEPSRPVQDTNGDCFAFILGSRKGLKERRISQITLRYVTLQARIIAKLYKVLFFYLISTTLKKMPKYIEIKTHLKCNFSLFVSGATTHRGPWPPHSGGL
jgi:hypothetical protein